MKPMYRILPALARRDERSVCAVRIKDAVRIFETENLVMLDQIDTVHTEPLQGLVELPRGFAP